MTTASRVLVYALHAAATFVVVLTTVRYIDRPLRADDVEFAIQVKGILAHGVPKVLFAEDRMQHVPGYFGYDARYGLWHPPLYEYALAAAVGVAGDHNWTYRSVGVVCLAISLFALYRITRDALGADVGLACLLIPIALAVLSPFVAEGALVVDIDNTTLCATMLCLLWRFLRPGDRYSPGRVVELAGWLCLSLVSKLTTPFVLMASLAMYAALGPRPVRSVARVLEASVAAVVVFAVLYWVYCRIFSLPPAFMFDVSYIGKRNLYSSIKSLRSILFAARWYVVWWSPVTVSLFLLTTCRRIVNFWRTRVLAPVDLLVIFSCGVFVCYIVVGAMWGKYAMPGAMAGAAAIGLDLAGAIARVEVRRPVALWLAAAGMALAAAWLPVAYARPAMQDPGGALSLLLADPRNVSAVALTALALLFALAAGRWWLRAPSRGRAVSVALIVALVVTTPVVTARVVLPNFDRGPYRPFSDRGFSAVVAHLDRVVPEDGAVLAPKDVGYVFRGRYYALNNLLAGGLDKTHDVALRPDVRAIVDSALYPMIPDPRFFDGLDIVRVDAIGDFRVYVKRPR